MSKSRLVGPKAPGTLMGFADPKVCLLYTSDAADE